eukprot:2275615-Rhodomonas_salina.1
MDWDRGPKNDWIGRHYVSGAEIRNAPAVPRGQGKVLVLSLQDKHGMVVHGVDKQEAVVELKVRRLPEEHGDQREREHVEREDHSNHSHEGLSSPSNKQANPVPANGQSEGAGGKARQAEAEQGAGAAQTESSPAFPWSGSTPSSGGGPGKMKVHLHGQVEVLVVGAKHLPKMDVFGTCDPFVVLKYGGKEAKTEVIKNTYTAKFNERFVLNILPEGGDDSLEV